MPGTMENIKPKYLVDEKGHKKSVMLSLKEYENIMELIDDLEDAVDLLKADRKATAFTPYEKFRKTWLKV